MNKRNTEGYVLAYVLIVITVMGMIAATLMTSTLQVITAQEKSIEYMKDKYEAMGEVERLVAGIATFPSLSDKPGDLDGAQSTFKSYISRLDTSNFSYFNADFLDSSANRSNIYTYVIKLTTSTSDSVSISAEIHTRVFIAIDEIPKNPHEPDDPDYNEKDTTYSYYYSSEVLDSSFYSYEIVGGDT